MADLVTAAFVRSALAGGGMTLGAAQQAALPSLIAAASRAVRKHCNRYFSRSIFDGLYTADGPSTWVLLREYPVNAVLRVAVDPAVILTVYNTDSATNQRAYCSIAQSDAPADVPDLPPPATGLKLVRVADGTAVVGEGLGVLLFANYPTVGTLATAVTALGHGWRAAAAGGFEKWPTADPEFSGLCSFRPVQQAIPALSPAGAGLVTHTRDIAVRLTSAAGDVDLSGAGAAGPFASARFGPAPGAEFGDPGDLVGYQGVRVIYDAGMDSVYEDVQQAVVETVAYWMVLAGGADQTLVEEKIGSYEYKIDTKTVGKFGLPASAVGKLSYYRNNRC